MCGACGAAGRAVRGEGANVGENTGVHEVNDNLDV